MPLGGRCKLFYASPTGRVARGHRHRMRRSIHIRLGPGSLHTADAADHVPGLNELFRDTGSVTFAGTASDGAGITGVSYQVEERETSVTFTRE